MTLETLENTAKLIFKELHDHLYTVKNDLGQGISYIRRYNNIYNIYININIISYR